MQILPYALIGLVFLFWLIALAVRRRRRVEPTAPIARSIERGDSSAVDPGSDYRRSRRALEARAKWPHLVALVNLRPAPPDASPPDQIEIAAEASRELSKQLNRTSASMGSRTRILQELSGTDWDLRKLADIIGGDPVIAGTVLGVVNSGFYGLRHRVASISQAVSLLGKVEVRNLVWRAGISNSLGLNRSPVQDLVDRLWRHSFAVSRTAHELAKLVKLARPDEISTTALLHDIGKFIFLSAHPDDARELYSDVGFGDETLLREEERRFGLSHPQCGRVAGEQWGLPGKANVAIGLHHAPSYVTPREVEADLPALAVLHVADLICHCEQLDETDAGGQIYAPRPGWLNLLGLGLGAPDTTGSASPRGGGGTPRDRDPGGDIDIDRIVA